MRAVRQRASYLERLYIQRRRPVHDREVKCCKSVTKIEVPQAKKMRGKEMKNGDKKKLERSLESQTLLQHLLVYCWEKVINIPPRRRIFSVSFPPVGRLVKSGLHTVEVPPTSGPRLVRAGDGGNRKYTERHNKPCVMFQNAAFAHLTIRYVFCCC